MMALGQSHPVPWSSPGHPAGGVRARGPCSRHSSERTSCTHEYAGFKHQVARQLLFKPAACLNTVSCLGSWLR